MKTKLKRIFGKNYSIYRKILNFQYQNENNEIIVISLPLLHDVNFNINDQIIFNNPAELDYKTNDRMLLFDYQIIENKSSSFHQEWKNFVNFTNTCFITSTQINLIVINRIYIYNNFNFVTEIIKNIE